MAISVRRQLTGTLGKKRWPGYSNGYGKGGPVDLFGFFFTDSQAVLVGVAYATVMGHCWSVFIGFKGGLGGAVTFAVLASLAYKEAFIAVAVFLIVLFSTRKTSWGTYILLGVTSLALLIERESLIMVLFPLGLNSYSFN